MFVYHRQDLPADAEFPAELDKLGYFINDKDQIRKISDPTQEFQFKINRNDRWNEVQRAAMNECIRKIVLSRLNELGLVTLRLPLTSDPTKPHVPILVSRNLANASRIVLVFGEPVQDLGIWAYRTVGTEGINVGSAVDFVKAVLSPGRHDNSANANGININGANGAAATNEHSDSPSNGDTAVILANTGQLFWHCGLGKAMTFTSKLALPRASAVDPPLAETERNKIPGNRHWQEHVDSVFEELLDARGRLIRNDARIDVIGAAEGGLAVVRYLGRNWSTWSTHISAICLANPLHTVTTDLLPLELEAETQVESNGNGTTNGGPNQASFPAFLSSRCRAYLLSPEPLGFRLENSESQKHGCNCYSSGEELNAECIIPKAWRSMLGWLGKVFEDEGFCEQQLLGREVGGEGDVDEGEDGVIDVDGVASDVEMV
ncbi:uncharacterized protein BDV17DRAFT_299410 [Aspergillus undulatus]|uniref:uncharacterized protein n=1 Tax=Aspergillus undulatus TaxID=1810928 RepID=UPI003CCD5C5D